MMQRPLTGPESDGNPVSFRDGVLEAVRYQLDSIGPEKTRELFFYQKGFYCQMDGWAEIARTADAMICDYERQPQMAMQPQVAMQPQMAVQPIVERPVMERPVMVQPLMERPVMELPVMEQPVENFVLKKFYDGRPIDFSAMKTKIGECLKYRLKYFYDWLALWRVLADLDLLMETQLTEFASQMQLWFPDASKKCNADGMGDYFSPYLGYTKLELWNQNDFMARHTSKQSLSGFLHIQGLATDLMKTLSPVPVIR